MKINILSTREISGRIMNMRETVGEDPSMVGNEQN